MAIATKAYVDALRGLIGLRQTDLSIVSVKAKAYAAKGDAVRLSMGTMTSGSNVFSDPNALFTRADIGKAISVSGAGVAGAALVTTIAGYTNGQTITTAANASTSIAPRTVTDAAATTGVGHTPGTTTSATAAFTAADACKTFSLTGAGVAGATLTGIINKQVNGTTVNITPYAATTVSNQTLVIGGAITIYGTDDTAAIQAAANAVPATGGEIYLPRGVYFVPNGGITFPYRTKFTGSGHGDRTGLANSEIVVCSLTANALTFQSSGCVLTDFALTHASLKNTNAPAPTAGIGILMSANDFGRMNRVTVSGFYTNIEIDQGYFWNLTDCTITDPVQYGVFSTTPLGEESDHGDQGITGCLFAIYNTTNRLAATAFAWRSGGGLRMVNNKINCKEQPVNMSAGTWTNGVDIAVNDGVSTSVMIISGNSFEGMTNACIQIRNNGSGTGTLSKIAITGNELGIQALAGVSIASTNINNISDIAITGNTIVSVSSGVFLQNVTDVTVVGNIFNTCNLALNMLNLNVTNWRYEGNVFRGDSLTEVGYSTTTMPSHVVQSQAKFNFGREIPSCTSNTTYVTLYRVLAIPNSAGVLDIVLAGVTAGGGNFLYRTSQAFQRTAGVITLTTIGTDTTLGTTIDVLLDVSAVSGEVQVKVRNNAGAATTDVSGICHLSITGQFATVRKGA